MGAVGVLHHLLQVLCPILASDERSSEGIVKVVGLSRKLSFTTWCLPALCGESHPSKCCTLASARVDR